MAVSTIKVQSKMGRGVEGKKVTLSLHGGQAVGYTDRSGLAVIEHRGVGRATVYVDGRDQGSFSAPGRYAVTL